MLHIKLEGALAETTVRADLDDLFGSHTVSKVRPQMDMDRA
ncbi:hypothetical protein [Methylobacterium persicinum]|uniref:Uncharacterized protein n=1 Tax=Methylobacterium persicinum TaxID=374426 RepID=A0ABU0HVC8_9HYPH|nr:hypothetical protein [Methylobacterium persicinum]MDQ0445454.1 hypothetical protein [Methylobacterium persicinum]GJE40817.1 hypothetical protein KHHGKMAE_4916 [Methylobacterium persicinum]